MNTNHQTTASKNPLFLHDSSVAVAPSSSHSLGAYNRGIWGYGSCRDPSPKFALTGELPISPSRYTKFTRSFYRIFVDRFSNC